jgi:hypothetical protein
MNEPLFSAPAIVCPHCGEPFIHNKINGIALLQTAASIDARKRMYCKLSLDDFERLSKDTGTVTFAQSKKIILDNYNDFVRDIQTILGLGNEAE